MNLKGQLALTSVTEYKRHRFENKLTSRFKRTGFGYFLDHNHQWTKDKGHCYCVQLYHISDKKEGRKFTMSKKKMKIHRHYAQ